MKAWIERQLEKSRWLRKRALRTEDRRLQRMCDEATSDDDKYYCAMQQIEIDEELRDLEDRPLLRRARDLHVATPPWPQPPGAEADNEWWKFSPFLGRYILTEEGVRFVRQRIHEEEARRREVWKYRRGWIAALAPYVIGALGALTGLMSVLRK